MPKIVTHRCKYCDEIIDPEIQDQFCSCECEMLYVGEQLLTEDSYFHCPPFDPPYTYKDQIYIQ